MEAGHASLAVTSLFAHASPHALAVHLGGGGAAARSGDAYRRTLRDRRQAQRARREEASA